MSREPSFTSMQASLVLGGWTNAVRPRELAAPETTQPPRGAQRKRNFKVVVEPTKPKPATPVPTRGYHQRVQALTKMVSTTEALTAEEKKILRGYRLSTGGSLAEATRREIEAEVRRR